MPGRECLTGPYLHYRLLLLALITDWSFFFRLSEPERPVCCFKLNFEMVSLVTDGRKSKLRHLFYGASLQRKKKIAPQRGALQIISEQQCVDRVTLVRL